MRSGHTKRVITAAIAVPIVLFVVSTGGPGGTAWLVALTAVLGLLEYYGLFLSGESPLLKSVGVVFCLALTAVFYGGHGAAGLGVFAMAFLVFSTLGVARFGSQTNAPDRLFRHMTGLVYIPFFLGHIILIRAWPQGAQWTLFLLAVVFFGDTAAYYVGKAIGRHKLCPRISPGKTVEGAIGGLGASLLAGYLFKTYWLPILTWPLCFGLAGLLSLVSQTGDLVESMFKRSVEIKDSGKLLPGHGGVLDRIDGLLFAAPILYYFKTYTM
jgi:phosphatidate cytidylyltransferase